MASLFNLNGQKNTFPVTAGTRAGDAQVFFSAEGQKDNTLTRNIQLGLKRLFDIVFSGSVLIVLLPLFLVLIVLVKLDSPGPAFFSQIRWGKNGKKIRIFKFRSMYSGVCDPTGVAQTVAGDARVTRLGAFLRRSNMDELPQFFNVLRGDMSVIGPRCHAVGMRAAGMLYEDLVPQYHLRHQVRPGLTGLAQVRGWRGPTDKADWARARIAADLHYIENFSLTLDANIFIATIANELKGGEGF